MEEIVKTLPQHTSSWSKGRLTYCMYEGFWMTKRFHEGVTNLAQQSYKAQPNDVFLCSSPKTGTTWLKALALAIVTRNKFDESNSPLLRTTPHDFLRHLEVDPKQSEENQNSSFPLVATHLPYALLPKSVVTSTCKIVYIYRNIKDVVASHYHFEREKIKLSVEDAPFEEAFHEFCQGISNFGPYWDHILGYWKASLERPGTILFLKYEDLKRDPMSHVKTLAEFIGYPFSREEENAGVVENIINLCSFKNLSNLEVNKTGSFLALNTVVENRTFFRKATDGDWENYFTDEMKEKIDKLIYQKMSGTGLILT
ncbi:flavonol 4'-sulfotransferase [Artemisia annua]|uniref:Sulfotransferase n=1 Tax=Artemisia annua TaxID=35608 RepID=A0A2U1KC57_ARTAN|nr:flavonol 4'-sulfotransferase [Artemisia annua]